MSEWRPVNRMYPEANERVLIATDGGEVGVGRWDPEAGWLMETQGGLSEIQSIYWMPLPEYPDP